MLHREDDEGLVVITQPGHSWVSGQIARSWGNDFMGDFSPREEVCLAAEQHDIGFLNWERSPTLNAETGHPHNFMDMPVKPHLEIWSTGVRNIQSYSRYAALLVSLHCTGLCERHYVSDASVKARLTADFLEEQRALQAELLKSLRADPAYAVYSADKVISRNRRLLAAWDYISLMLCMKSWQPHLVSDLPASAGSVDLTLTPLKESRTSVAVDPWPFQTELVKVVCEGRRLARPYKEEEEMRSALQSALPLTISIHLSPK